MKYYFACYNYFTLYIAFVYTTMLQKEGHNCILIYQEHITPIPAATETVWDQVFLVNSIVSKDIRLKLFRQFLKHKEIKRAHEIEYAYNYKKLLTKIIRENENSTLYCFKDNNCMDATLIELYKQRTKGKGSVILIEEGMAIYATGSEPSVFYSNPFIRLARCIVGISTFAIKPKYPQGYHPDIDKIICNAPNCLDHYKKAHYLCMKLPDFMFVNENIRGFIHGFLGYTIEEISIFNDCSYLYITQPLDKDSDVSTSNECDKILIETAKSIGPEIKMLIKLHPREKKDRYDHIIEMYPNIKLLEQKLNVIPVEILYPFLNSPVVITPYSSAYQNIIRIDKEAKIILIYKLIINKKYIERINMLVYPDKEIIEIPETYDEYVTKICFDKNL